MPHTAISGYRIMWLMLYFDLPTETKTDRKNYARFRKALLQDGFSMLQYSVYARHCASRENAEVHLKRVKNWLPPKGKVSVMEITDTQFGRILNFWGRAETPPPAPPLQMELF